MASKELTYKITTDSKQAVAGIKQFSSAVKKEMKGASDALDDTRTAGQKAADALSKMADQMEADLKSSADAADALAAALGDTADHVDVAGAVADLNKMGLTFEEIEADAEALAAALKRIDDVKVDGAGIKDVADETDHAAESVKHLGGEADQSTSVLANMAGNTASELGELGGVAGTAGMAIGQLAEYATEGNISLSGLAQVAGPMAGLTAVTILASEAMKEHAKRAEVAKKNTQAWADAIEEGGDVVANLTKAQRESNEQIEATRKMSAGAYLPFVDSTEQLNDNLAAVSLTAAQFNQMARDGDVAIGEWAKAQLDAGTSLKDVTTIVNAARDSHKGFEEATAAAAANLVVFGDAVDDVANRQRLAGAASDGITNFLEQQAIAQQAAADAVTATADAYGAAEEAQNDFYDSQRAAVDAQYAAEKAADDLIDTIAGYGDAVKGAEGDTRKLKDVQIATRDAAIKYADGQVKAKQDTAAAAGEYRTAEQDHRDYLGALIESTAYMSGPQKQAVLDHIARIEGIPPEKVTEILADPNNQSIDAATAALAKLEKPLTAPLTVNTKILLPNGWTLDKYGTVHGPGNITLQSLPVPPSTAPVAPVGPTQHAATPATVSTGGVSNFAVTINTRANGRDTVRALDRWARVNGGRRR